MKIGLLNPQYNQSFKATLEFNEESFEKFKESKKSKKFKERHPQKEIETVDKCCEFLKDKGSIIAKEAFPEDGVIKVSVKEGKYEDWYGFTHKKAILLNIDYYKNSEAKKSIKKLTWSPESVSQAKFLRTLGIPSDIPLLKLPIAMNTEKSDKVMPMSELLKRMSKSVDTFDEFCDFFAAKMSKLANSSKIGKKEKNTGKDPDKIIKDIVFGNNKDSSVLKN